MELACNIIRQNKNKHSYSSNENITKFKTLRLMDMTQQYTASEYLLYINNPNVINVTNNLINTYINNKNNLKITNEILRAYYISGYADKIFPKNKSIEDVKLIDMSNKIVVMLEKIDKIKTDQLIRSIDIYHSLYQIWDNKNMIISLNIKLTELIDYVKINKITIKKCGYEQLESSNEHLYNLMKDVLQYNTFGIMLLLQNYNNIISNQNIINILWNNLNNQKDKNHIMLILITELRILLLNNTKKINIKKKLYYSIDIEKITTYIRKNKFNVSKMNEIIYIFLNITQTQYDKNKLEKKKWDSEYNTYVLELFRKMYDVSSIIDIINIQDTNSLN